MNNVMSNRIKKFREMKFWQKWIAIILVSILIGVVVEALICAFTKKSIGNQAVIEEIPVDDIYVNGNIHRQDGLFVGNDGKIVLNIPEKYICKLRYYYEANENFKNIIKIKFINGYDLVQEKVVDDSSSKSINYSVINLYETVTEIEITVQNEIKLGNFVILNEVDFNNYRALFIAAFCMLILFVFLFSESISKHVELGFSVIGLVVGLTIIALQPPQCMGWDEHIHMYKAFDMFEFGEIPWSEAEYYTYYNPESFDSQYFHSREEKAMHMQYLNNVDNNIVYSYEKEGYSLNDIGRLPMALGVAFGKCLGMPYYVCFLLGKIANLLLYVGIMSIVIRILPIAKRTVAVLGLMPTPMVLATAYSYDVVVISFIFLGTALLVREYIMPKQIIKYRNICLVFVCFLLGAAPKMLYLPLILGVLFLPKSKFSNKKIYYFFRSMSIMMASLCIIGLIYVSMSGIVTGDSRGGDTSVDAQLDLIFHNLGAYLKILFDNVKNSANAYVLGYESFSNMAYAGHHQYYLLITLLIFGVAITEPRTELPKESYKSLKYYRGISVVLIIGVIALIWTALYVVFTEVGSIHILGVQGRYYIPLFLPFIIVLYTDKVKCLWDSRKYTIIMNLLILFIWIQAVYSKYLIPYCV